MRSIEKRCKEQQCYLRLGEEVKSALASHGWTMGSRSSSQKQTTPFILFFHGWVVRESLKIRLENDVVNEKDGLKLSGVRKLTSIDQDVLAERVCGFSAVYICMYLLFVKCQQ